MRSKNSVLIRIVYGRSPESISLAGHVGGGVGSQAGIGISTAFLRRYLAKFLTSRTESRRTPGVSKKTLQETNKTLLAWGIAHGWQELFKVVPPPLPGSRRSGRRRMSHKTPGSRYSG